MMGNFNTASNIPYLDDTYVSDYTPSTPAINRKLDFNEQIIHDPFYQPIVETNGQVNVTTNIQTRITE